MTQMWLLWWPKNASSTKAGGGDTGGATTTTSSSSATSITTVSSSLGQNGSPKYCCCSCLAKLVRKLKKRGRMLRSATTSRQPSSFHCRYDPLSYSLNFDTSGCGSMLDDEDYYHFCAFSSRFVANPRPSCPRLVATSH